MLYRDTSHCTGHYQATFKIMIGDRRDRIRHEGPVRLWQQVADDLRADIRSGAIPSGARLPSYLSLADSYGVAALTIRRAILELRREHLVTVTVGRGTYVV